MESRVYTTATEVKSVGDWTIKGRAIVYGARDIVGDTFTKDTDIGDTRSFDGLPVYYDHALGGAETQIGTVKAWIANDDGIDVEIEIDKRVKYAEKVMELVKKGVLGLSTGAVAHLVRRQNGELKRWIVGEVSLTPTPAEPRTIVESKSGKPYEQIIETNAEYMALIGNPSKKHSDGNIQNESSQLGANTMPIDRNELIDALADVAGEPVNGGGVIQAPAHIKNTKLGSGTAMDAQLHYLRTGIKNAEVKATIQEDSGTGALLVEKDWEREIVAKRDAKSLLGQLPIVRRTTNREYYDVNGEDGQSDFAFVSEIGAANQDEPTFVQREIRLYRASLLIKVSNKFLADTTSNFLQYMNEAVGRAYARNINQYMLVGTGSGQPQGIIPRITNIVDLDTTTGLTAANIQSIFYGLPSGYHDSTETGWAMRMSTLGAIRSLTINGSYAYQNTPAGTNVNGNEFLNYRPVADAPGMAEMAASAKSIIFGNWTYARFVEHSQGLMISRNPYLYEATGETGFFVTAYWGSDVINADAFVVGRNAAS